MAEPSPWMAANRSQWRLQLNGGPRGACQGRLGLWRHIQVRCLVGGTGMLEVGSLSPLQTRRLDGRLNVEEELADTSSGLTSDWNRSSDRLEILAKLVSVLQNDKRRCRHGRKKKPERYVERQAASLLQSSNPSVIITRANRLKKDWCRTEPLWQKISERGCVSKTIMNHFCYGQCNSFYIPQTSNKTFQSCPFCKPYSAKWTRVNLRCPSRIPFVKRIKVLLVQKCRCIAEILR
ncbi:gremlin-2-like [Centruroides sculpturatus]|uniref:gremlin-2-like n=1 Tax=Centruroides sculpturatus TaxID=218467 RepID=UPI000C6CFBF3|nr:gremlin-2-like [Centruroides sculpturatus]